MRLLPILLLLAAAAPAAEPSADDYRADARRVAPLIQETYAYLDRFPGDSGVVGRNDLVSVGVQNRASFSVL